MRVLIRFKIRRRVYLSLRYPLRLATASGRIRNMTCTDCFKRTSHPHLSLSRAEECGRGDSRKRRLSLCDQVIASRLFNIQQRGAGAGVVCRQGGEEFAGQAALLGADFGAVRGPDYAGQASD